MPKEVIMPKVDMDMASGKIMSWHVAEGATVSKGDPLFDIETDKAAMEVEAEAAGILHHRAPEGSDIAIGEPVAWLYAEGEAVGDPPNAPAQPDAAPKQPQEPTRPGPDPGPLALDAPSETDKTRATPSARRLARENALALDTIPGTGPRGRVQRADVEAALPATAPAGFAAETGPLAITRKDGSGTPLLLIHGFGSDALSWAPLERHLSGRSTIRIDLPSHGKSPLRSPADFAALARDVRQAVDDLALDRFELVGHSLGGAVALALADIRPRKLERLTLIAPAGLGPDINGTTLDGITRATRPESLAPWLKTLVADESIVTDSYARLAHAARPAPMRMAQAAMADRLFPDAVQAFDLRPALKRLTLPTRIVWGKADRIIPWRHALEAPGPVALHLFEHLGHIPQIEAPEAIGEILSNPL